MSPREVIMQAIATCRVDLVAQGYAPLCRRIEIALDEAGYVIVPREPTQAMVCAAERELREAMGLLWPDGGHPEDADEHHRRREAIEAATTTLQTKE